MGDLVLVDKNLEAEMGKFHIHKCKRLHLASCEWDQHIYGVLPGGVFEVGEVPDEIYDRPQLSIPSLCPANKYYCGCERQPMLPTACTKAS